MHIPLVALLAAWFSWWIVAAVLVVSRGESSAYRSLVLLFLVSAAGAALHGGGLLFLRRGKAGKRATGRLVELGYLFVLIAGMLFVVAPILHEMFAASPDLVRDVESVAGIVDVPTWLPSAFGAAGLVLLAIGVVFGKEPDPQSRSPGAIDEETFK